MTNKKDLRIRSKVISEGVNRVPNRAMLRAVGFTDEDFKKPMIGVASTWSEVTPCNMHIDKLAIEAKQGVRNHGGAPLIFNTITVSDGISMGHGGMLFSLPSREAIADSIEIVTGAERFDGIVAIGGCDKNTPACLMAIGRMNIPAVYVYGGTIQPGNSKARTWISLRLLKRSGNIMMEKCQTSSSIRLSAASARDRALVVACTQPIRWPLRQKPWG